MSAARPGDPPSAVERLYGLLPAFLCEADAESGEPLRALLAVLQWPYDRLDAAFREQYEDWFVETCGEAALGRIAELVGIPPGDLPARGAGPASNRRWVGDNLAYRRRKGTRWALGRAASDIAGWPVRVLEMARRTASTESLLDPREGAPGTLDLADLDTLDRLGGPYDRAVHGVDLRRPNRSPETADLPLAGPGVGRYDTPNLGLYVWRLESYPRGPASARRVGPGEYTCDPFGLGMPLFAPAYAPPPPPGAGDPPVEPPGSFPSPLTPDLLRDELEVARCGGWGARRAAGALAVWVGRERVPESEIRVLDRGEGAEPREGGERAKSGHGGGGRRSSRPGSARILVDPGRGRLLFPGGVSEDEEVEVLFHYGLAGDVGGGPYERRDRLVPTWNGSREGWWLGTVGRRVARLSGAGAGTTWNDLGPALEAWAASGDNGVVVLADSRSYELGVTVRVKRDLPAADRLAARSLTLQAIDGECPCLVGDLTIEGEADVPLTVRLSGLWIDGAIRLRGRVRLELADVTLRPGSGGGPEVSLEAREARAGEVEVDVERSIVGALRLPADARGLHVRDSVVDGGAGAAIAGSGGAGGTGHGPRTVLDRVTVFGRTEVSLLERARDVLFDGGVEVERPASGEVETSWVPPGSRTPARRRSQPDLATAGVSDPAERETLAARAAPVFTSRRYGRPGYAQLAAGAPVSITAGGSGGGAMGVFHGLYPAERFDALSRVLERQVPWGMVPEVFFVT